ncbi:MAG: UDP-glucose 4-epimerase GalE [Betaproteobacteria bacterium HGW-Betaproteobacteria-21]|nr:MAG: UDP-glucose 4-epimerase GalE [Betaproteobacteria bacterium HGW-Betaproteobacteria-21]
MSLILVTGGAGYIGSHTCLALLRSGHEVLVVDDFSNSSPVALERVQALAGKRIRAVVEADVRDCAALETLFNANRVDAVIHFAAKKAVGESVRMPLAYYENNLGGLLALVEVMAKHSVKRLVFSSSATVYGDPASVPIDECFPTSATNPYGRTKLMSEEILRDVVAADPSWKVALLRYFNPVGADESGQIGEDPNGLPNNLMPYVSQVAVGKLGELQVFGNDYPTPDGTGVRDYIHVADLARGHVNAVERFDALPAVTTVNLGTGRGYSVLEVVRAFELASGQAIPYRIVPRRSGDVAECWANPGLAQQLLGWAAERDIDAMCRDAWRWQQGNPDGYGTLGPE